MALDQTDYTQLNSPTSNGDKMATHTEDALKVQKVLAAFLDASGNVIEAQESDGTRLPTEPHAVETFSETLAAPIASMNTVDNSHGFNSVGFHCVPPTGATILFEGSFDGVNWVPITFREVGGDGYVNRCAAEEDYIGSIAGLRSFRFRNSDGGSAAGSAVGTIFHPPTTMEGIEHGNPPHNIGVAIKRFHVNVTGAAADQVLYTPASGKRFYCTGYAIGINSNGTVVIFDETDAAANYLFSAEAKNVTTTVFSNHTFSPVPFESAAADNEIKITTTGLIEVRGVVTGYEA